MKTEMTYIGKKSEKEWQNIILDFNACHDAKDKKHEICNWMKKYTSVTDFSEVTAFCGKITLTENPTVYFGKTKIEFWAN
jgi:hypothetical protein